MLHYRKRLFVLSLFLGLLFSFALLSCVHAADVAPPWGADSIPSELQPEGNEIGFRGESAWDFIEAMVSRVAGYLFTLGMIIAPIVILLGVFMIFTAAGDPTKVQSAKKLIFWTVAILGVLLAARIAISAIRYVVSFR